MAKLVITLKLHHYIFLIQLKKYFAINILLSNEGITFRKQTIFIIYFIYECSRGQRIYSESQNVPTKSHSTKKRVSLYFLTKVVSNGYYTLMTKWLK